MKLLAVHTQSTKLFRNFHTHRTLCANLFRGLSKSKQDPKARLTEICASGKLPETFNFATDVFDVHAAQTPSKLALWMDNEFFQDRKWNFTQLRTESVRAAVSLRKSIKSKTFTLEQPNSTIFVLLPRVPEWWFIYLASLRLGTIFCPATTMLSPEDIAYRLKTSGAKIVVTNEANMWKVEKAQRLENFPTPVKIVVPEKKGTGISSDGWIQFDELTDKILDADILGFKNAITKSEDLSQIFFTSGTTGKPKMVAHSHTSYGIGHISTCSVLGMESTDIFWCLSDPGWAKSSYGNIFSPWIAGAGVYINQVERFEPKKVMEILCKRPITGLCAAPTLFRSMVQETDDYLYKFKSLRFSMAGGEALNDEVVQTWKSKTGLDVGNIYGQTESTAMTTYGETGERKPSSMGISSKYFEMKIVDDAGNEVPTGTEGHIGIKIKPKRPVGLFKGYIKEGTDTFEIDENHKSFVGDYYFTGDLGYMDSDGHIFYVSRDDDVIISAGYRIGPFEVESILQTHPAVAENAVIASPDSLRGAVVKAFIILSEQFRNSDKQELTKNIQNYFKENGAPYKYPRKIEFVDSLPKTISGKIMRRELRQQELATLYVAARD